MTRDNRPTRDTLYVKLADKLRDKIYARHYPPGSQLPTEQQLIEEYGVSRTVVRGAIDLLIHEGLVIRKQGSGTFVLPPPQTPYIMEPAQDPWADLAATSEATPDRGYPDPGLADLLTLAPGAGLHVCASWPPAAPPGIP